MTRPSDAPTTFPNGPMVAVRRSARPRRAPTRYEPDERPEDDFDGSESEGEGESEGESEGGGEGGAQGADGAGLDRSASGSDSDDDTAGSLRDFVVDDEVEGSSDGEVDTNMMEESDLEGYTTTDDDEMDWSPGGSSRTDSESEGDGESDDDRE